VLIAGMRARARQHDDLLGLARSELARTQQLLVQAVPLGQEYRGVELEEIAHAVELECLLVVLRHLEHDVRAAAPRARLAPA
jgi:hypothetical protein